MSVQIDTYFENFPTFKFHKSQTPSWLHHGKGCATIEIKAHVEAKWLAFRCVETNLEYNGRSKDVMIDMTETEGRELLAFLKSIYEPSKGS